MPDKTSSGSAGAAVLCGAPADLPRLCKCTHPADRPALLIRVRCPSCLLGFGGEELSKLTSLTTLNLQGAVPAPVLSCLLSFRLVKTLLLCNYTRNLFLSEAC